MLNALRLGRFATKRLVLLVSVFGFHRDPGTTGYLELGVFKSHRSPKASVAVRNPQDRPLCKSTPLNPLPDPRDPHDAQTQRTLPQMKQSLEPGIVNRLIIVAIIPIYYSNDTNTRNSESYPQRCQSLPL